MQSNNLTKNMNIQLKFNLNILNKDR